MKRYEKTQAITANHDFDLDRLLHPGRFYGAPVDVLDDGILSAAEKRAILSSWASDACAIESNPVLRAAEGSYGTTTFDDIMDALARLDRLEAAPPIRSGKRLGDWTQSDGV
jgi:hypothetical protein